MQEQIFKQFIKDTKIGGLGKVKRPVYEPDLNFPSEHHRELDDYHMRIQATKTLCDEYLEDTLSYQSKIDSLKFETETIQKKFDSKMRNIQKDFLDKKTHLKQEISKTERKISSNREKTLA